MKNCLPREAMKRFSVKGPHDAPVASGGGVTDVTPHSMCDLWGRCIQLVLPV